MDLFRLILGFALLFTGRRLYWLFLGGIGFVLGYDIAREMIGGQPRDVIFIIALCAGVAGAMLAVFFQKVAIWVGGFVAGGYLLTELLKGYGGGIGHYHWLMFIIGGLIGAVLMKVLFRWTLIVLSCFVGSGLIIGAVHTGPQLARLLFVLLLITGIAVQTGFLGRKSSRQR
jgi:hypothetical protein